MRKLFFPLLGLLLFHNVSMAQDEKFKALFVYNFTKYIEWPTTKQSGDFLIGVLGESSIIDELKSFTSKKTVGSQAIKVEKILSAGDYAKCNIIVITAKASSQTQEVVEKIKGKGVLVVTDKQGLANEYSGINFIKIDGQQNFEISQAHLADQGVKISKSLLSLGTVID